MPVVNAVTHKTGQYGPYTVLTIDGREFNLGKFCQLDPTIQTGDTVNYEAAPSRTGKMYVNRISKVAPADGAAPAPAATPAPATTNSEAGSLHGDTAKDTDIRRQVCWKLAARLLASAMPEGDQSHDERVAALGEKIFDRYQAARRGNRPT